MLSFGILMFLVAVLGIVGFTIWFILDDIKQYDDDVNDVW